jgi:hypothetical protein
MGGQFREAASHNVLAWHGSNYGVCIFFCTILVDVQTYHTRIPICRARWNKCYGSTASSEATHWPHGRLCSWPVGLQTNTASCRNVETLTLSLGGLTHCHLKTVPALQGFNCASGELPVWLVSGSGRTGSQYRQVLMSVNTKSAGF